jgi:hypothetical protein
MVLAAQRSGSARAASSGPTTLPKPRQASKFFFFIKNRKTQRFYKTSAFFVEAVNASLGERLSS